MFWNDGKNPITMKEPDGWAARNHISFAGTGKGIDLGGVDPRLYSKKYNKRSMYVFPDLKTFSRSGVVMSKDERDLISSLKRFLKR